MMTIDDSQKYLQLVKDNLDDEWLQSELQIIHDYYKTNKNTRVLGNPEDIFNPLAYLIYQSENALDKKRLDPSLGISQDIMRITTLGTYFEILQNSKVIGFKEKVLELINANKESFEKIIFEINIAAAFLKSNHKVNFIETKSVEHKKTPDLLVDNKIEVECKKKDRLTPRDIKNHDSWNHLQRKLISLMNSIGKFYFIYIYFENDPSSKTIKNVLKKIRKIISSDKQGEFVDEELKIFMYPTSIKGENFTLPIKIENKNQLSDRLTPEIFDNLLKSKIPNHEILDYKKQKPDFDTINFRTSLFQNGDVVIGEMMKFLFKTKQAPDRLTSVIKSIKDAKSQLSGDRCSIICVNLTNISHKLAEPDYVRLGDMVNQTLQNNSTISAVAITSEFFTKDVNGMRFQHKSSVIRNKDAKFPLPEDFKILN